MINNKYDYKYLLDNLNKYYDKYCIIKNDYNNNILISDELKNNIDRKD